MEKVILDIKKGKATIEKGKESFMGKLLSNHKGKIKFKTPLGEGEFDVKK